ncbi:MAG: hypothetical protein FWF38_01405 [Spirochaetaceae bacterium]|nr:hypothetical protein [Spirochaetaceae bacterium]
MDESVFIISQGSRYGKKIADKFLANNYRVIKTISDQESEISENSTAGGASPETESMLTEISWNYRSPFSSKNITISLKNHPDIKNFIIVYSIPEEDTPIYKQSQIEIQKIIDLYIKSQISITCEFLNDFSKNNRSANLFLVLENSNSNNPFREFFKNFINTILGDDTLPVNINAFEIGKEPPDPFADYVFSIIQDKKAAKGKWFKQFRYTLF